MPILNTIKDKQTALLQTLFGGLCLAYFAVQPFNIYTADAIWLALALASLVFVIVKTIRKESFDIPKELRTLLWLCACFPLVSIISYLFTPLDDLTPDRLEPDTRWLLIIPIIIAMRAVRIGPTWIIAFLCTYAFSAFISVSIETHWYSRMDIRADGHENAVPFGMFNATVAGMLLAVLFFPKLKEMVFPIHTTIIRIIVVIAALAAIIATLLSGTRAAVLLIPVIIFALIFLYLPKTKSIPIVVVVMLLFAGTAYLTKDTQINKKIQKGFINAHEYITTQSTSSIKTSLGQRLEQWRESWCIFTKYPLLGTGPRSYRNAHQAYGGTEHCNGQQLNWYYKSKGGSYQAHSLYLNTLATTGLAGMLLLGWFFYRSTQFGLAVQRKTTPAIHFAGILLLIVIVSHLFNGLTLDLWFRNHVMNKNVLIWALPVLALLPVLTKPEKSIT